MEVRPNDRDGATVDLPPDRKGEISMGHDILPRTFSTARDLLLSRQRVWRGQSHAPVLPGPCQLPQRGERDVAHAALQLISGQSATSETSAVAQLRAELSAATDFQHQLVLQNDNLTGWVNDCSTIFGTYCSRGMQ